MISYYFEMSLKTVQQANLKLQNCWPRHVTTIMKNHCANGQAIVPGRTLEVKPTNNRPVRLTAHISENLVI